jgi:hydroxymethylglutaryl-CoA synthase
MKTSPPVGIDDITFAFPQLYLPIPTLAEMRGLEADKLRLGLGLEKMAIPDVGEDVVTLGASAVKALIDRNRLDPRQIGRLYLGTESAIDGAKPTATFILSLLEEHYAPVYGQNCFRHCSLLPVLALPMPCRIRWTGFQSLLTG